MKFPKLNNKSSMFALLLLIIIVLVSVGGGIYFSGKKEKELSKNQNQTEQDKEIQENLRKKEESFNNTQNTNSSQTGGESSEVSSAELSDVTLQGTINESNEIVVTLYGAAGTYKIQKLVGGNSVEVVDQATYSGRGGFEIMDKISAAESERTFWIYRIINGQESQKKAITVDREVIVKRGGITNFPEAQ